MAIRYTKGKLVECVANRTYRIEKDLSTGQFAVSYLAFTQDGKKVFLKQYKSPSVLVPWYDGYKAYQTELKRRITGNPQLVERTYEFIDFFERDRAFIQVFGFIEGGKDLKTYLEEGKMSVKERYTFASLLLYTLKLFHDAGIIHTDLKPDNVYLMPSSAKIGFNLKLIDFDFTVLEGKKAPWDGEMNYCGTPRYMSPEHLTGKVPEKRSDVFTAALMLYELLAQGHPYPDEEDAYAEAAKAGNPPKPVFIVPSTPETDALAALMMNALSAHAADRPFIGDLHAAILKARSSFLGARPSGGNGTFPPAGGSGTRPSPKTGTGGDTRPAPRPPTRPSGTEPTPPSRPIPGPRSRPVPKTAPASAPLPRQLGLSLDGAEGIDWFKTSSTFGRHSQVTATQQILKYLPDFQFSLRRNGSQWLILPPYEPPTNMTLVNGVELTEPVELHEGDVICLGSRKDASRRNLFPMTVHFKEATAPA